MHENCTVSRNLCILGSGAGEFQGDGGVGSVGLGKMSLSGCQLLRISVAKSRMLSLLPAMRLDVHHGR